MAISKKTIPKRVISKYSISQRQTKPENGLVTVTEVYSCFLFAHCYRVPILHCPSVCNIAVCHYLKAFFLSEILMCLSESHTVHGSIWLRILPKETNLFSWFSVYSLRRAHRNHRQIRLLLKHSRNQK